jgi:creatinine amidohydrolase
MIGTILSEKTYEEVSQIINEETILVLPIGGAAKEHGPHLPCGTDFYIVEELAQRIAEKCDVVVLPTLSYGYYPAFVEWPGSISINGRVFMDMVSDIIRPFASIGVKKFLLLDIGVSTQPPLKMIASDLHNELGIYVAVTDFSEIWGDIKDEICQQKEGGHADEAETSLMLTIKPELVKMEKAIEEYREHIKSTVVNKRKMINISRKMTSQHGIHGNPTFATKEKGALILEKSVAIIKGFLEEFKKI